MIENWTLTPEEVEKIAKYTIEKIESYPKEWGKTVENYFDILFPDEVTDYQLRRAIHMMRAKKEKVKKEKVCCFCGGIYERIGNNPAPVDKKKESRCCDFCNDAIVIPARLCKNFTHTSK